MSYCVRKFYTDKLTWPRALPAMDWAERVRIAAWRRKRDSLSAEDAKLEDLVKKICDIRAVTGS